MYNAFWDCRNFNVYAQTFPDSLHLADSGLFDSILTVVFADLKSKILGWSEVVNAPKKWEVCMHRLQERLALVRILDNIGVPAYVTEVGHRYSKALEAPKQTSSSPMFRAWEYRLLMEVLVTTHKFTSPIATSCTFCLEHSPTSPPCVP
jgi:hypothetical protein